MIVAYLDGASRMNVGILFIDSGFDSMYIPPTAMSDDPRLAELTGGVAVINIHSQMTIGGKAIPIGVSMMHELGHAKQYIQEPVLFEIYYNSAMSITSGKNIPQIAIETDNLITHEAPILQELGLPFRTKYD